MDYIEAFRNLKTNQKYSRKSPHKAILLLTIIEMIENNLLSENEIKYDETLKRVYVTIWNRCLPEEESFIPTAYFPFWHMQSEEFWHIVPIRGREDIMTLLRDSNVKPSEAKLADCVQYARLDDDLYFLMTMSSGRSALKKVLLETYTSLSSSRIAKLSVSKDNKVDYSIQAMNEYEQILVADSEKAGQIVTTIDSKMEEQFLELSEDIQYLLYIKYYTYLKDNPREREFIKEICPTVYGLYDRITNNHIQKRDISPFLVNSYDNFLSDLRVSLMGEDDSMELIDNIEIAINSLRGTETEPNEYETDKLELNKSTEVEPEIPTYASPFSSYGSTESVSAELPIANESRKGKPWSKEEEELITLFFNQGHSTDKIAIAMGRSEVSIKTRLASLGLIDYTYGEESGRKEEPDNNQLPTQPMPDEDNKEDFFVDNVRSNGYIYNRYGQLEFSTSGQLKIIRGRVYRFNYKSMCLTVKRIDREGALWIIGKKKLVAYSDSDLYVDLIPYEFIDDIEDFLEYPQMTRNRIKVRGEWFDYRGKRIDS